jgi:hypothetical protein
MKRHTAHVGLLCIIATIAFAVATFAGHLTHSFTTPPVTSTQTEPVMQLPVQVSEVPVDDTHRCRQER